MVRTFLAIRDVPLGFTNPENSPDAAHLDSSRQWSPTTTRWRALHEQIAHGIESDRRRVSRSAARPMSRWTATTTTIRSGSRTSRAPTRQIPPLRRHKYIGEGYFETMGNPVIAGRDLDLERRRHLARRWR